MADRQLPPGMTLRHVFRGHTKEICAIVWSPCGHFLASTGLDETVHTWGDSGEHRILSHDVLGTSIAGSADGALIAVADLFYGLRTIHPLGTGSMKVVEGGADVRAVAFAPAGFLLATGSEGGTVDLWTSFSQGERKLGHHNSRVRHICWDSTGTRLASASDDFFAQIWTPNRPRPVSLDGHRNRAISTTWNNEGRLVATGSSDNTARIWYPETGTCARILEGHTEAVHSVAFSHDGRILCTKSNDGTLRFWRTDTWNEIAVVAEAASTNYYHRIAFHPRLPVLATLGDNETSIRIWDLDIDRLLGVRPAVATAGYANAKVVLVGDSGVGKSGLSLPLCGAAYTATESTHGRRVWTFQKEEARTTPMGAGGRETREVLLWDLAGQPGYRLVHQLHLSEVAVALVVFDARSETDPFAGVRYWDRALRQAQRVYGKDAFPLVKFLVAARTDRGGLSVSRQRIDDIVREMGFAGYFETSAKEGWKISELAEAIRNAIPWTGLPRVTSNEFFESIKAYLLRQKESGRLLVTANDLFTGFLKFAPENERSPAAEKDQKGTLARLAAMLFGDKTPPVTHRTVGKDLLRDGMGAEHSAAGDAIRRVFDVCIGRVESRDLIRRLSFGDLVLLQPELIDAYAASLVNAARDEPEGLGSLNEEVARRAQFKIAMDERVTDPGEEKLLILATIEDLLRYEIALREGAEIVFPAQFTRENPALPDPPGKSVIFDFEGPTVTVYTTLAVRLAHSQIFKKKDMWKNAAEFTVSGGGTCGVHLREFGEGCGELTLFFDEKASEQTKLQFEQFVAAHLERRALPETIKRRRLFSCANCATVITDQQAQARRSRGHMSMSCPVCDSEVSLLDGEPRVHAVAESKVETMDRSADRRRDLAWAESVIAGKGATGEFDVFLCHHGVDKGVVKRIGKVLRELSLRPWLDEWELRPGLPWQPALEAAITKIHAAAIFVGASGRGPWQDREIEACLRKFVKTGCPVIPVILPDCVLEPELPVFLEGMTWVDLRKTDPSPLERLVWGITGKQPHETEAPMRNLLGTFGLEKFLDELRGAAGKPG